MELVVTVNVKREVNRCRNRLPGLGHKFCYAGLDGPGQVGSKRYRLVRQQFYGAVNAALPFPAATTYPCEFEAMRARRSAARSVACKAVCCLWHTTHKVRKFSRPQPPPPCDCKGAVCVNSQSLDHWQALTPSSLRLLDTPERCGQRARHCLRLQSALAA